MCNTLSGMSAFDRLAVHKRAIRTVSKRLLLEKLRSPSQDPTAQLQLLSMVSRAVAYNDIALYARCPKDWTDIGSIVSLQKTWRSQIAFRYAVEFSDYQRFVDVLTVLKRSTLDKQLERLPLPAGACALDSSIGSLSG